MPDLEFYMAGAPQAMPPLITAGAGQQLKRGLPHAGEVTGDNPKQLEVRRHGGCPDLYDGHGQVPYWFVREFSSRRAYIYMLEIRWSRCWP